MRRFFFALFYVALAAGVAALSGYLLVSYMVAATPEVAVPDVTGLKLSEALDRLASGGLDLEVRGFAFSDTVEENRVVRQRPVEGEVVKKGRSVGVVLSRGPERQLVPDVVGLPLEEATLELTRAGLSPVAAARVAAPGPGTVLAQARAPGSYLPHGGAVPLLVSDGPAPERLRMPRLEGLPQAEAERLASSLGLRIERVEEIQLGDPERAGRVVSQEPLAGFPVDPAAGVNLSVAGSGRRAGAANTVWLEYPMPPGPGEHTVEVVIVKNGSRTTLWSGKLASGATFKKLVPLGPGERALVLLDGKEP